MTNPYLLQQNPVATLGQNWGPQAPAFSSPMLGQTMPPNYDVLSGLAPNVLGVQGLQTGFNPLGANIGTGGGISGGGIFDMLKSSGFTGSTDKNGIKTDGWGGMALGAASGLASAFMGMKQYGLAKDTLAENKRQFGLNYDAQKSTTNTALEDRQRARVASNAGAYQSVGDYMGQNGIR